MGLRNIFRAALPDIFNAAGEEATFTPAGGSVIPCKIFIEFNVQFQPGGDSQTWEQGVSIEALLSEIGRTPTRGDVFTYPVDELNQPTELSVVYAFKAPISNDGLTVKVLVA